MTGPRRTLAFAMVLAFLIGAMIGSFSTFHFLKQTFRSRADVAYETVDTLRNELQGALSELRDSRENEASVVDSLNELVTQALSELEQDQRLRLSGVIERFLSASESAPEGAAIRAIALEVRDIYFDR